jgi:hypothetical protein
MSSSVLFQYLTIGATSDVSSCVAQSVYVLYSLCLVVDLIGAVCSFSIVYEGFAMRVTDSSTVDTFTTLDHGVFDPVARRMKFP